MREVITNDSQASIYTDWQEITATPGDVARIYLGLPERLGGLAIVDLCAGASSLAAHASAEGAKSVHAVDQCYKLEREVLGDAVTRSRDYWFRCAPTREIQRIMWHTIHESIIDFLEAYTDPATSAQYIGADVTELENILPSNMADYTVSLNGISRLTHDPAYFLSAMNQAIRITKPGGKIIIASRVAQDAAAQARAQKPFIHELRSNGVSEVRSCNVSIPDKPYLGPMHRVTLTKALY